MFKTWVLGIGREGWVKIGHSEGVLYFWFMVCIILGHWELKELCIYPFIVLRMGDLLGFQNHGVNESVHEGVWMGLDL